jgi:UDP-N-acetylmuramate dehydrogenase
MGEFRFLTNHLLAPYTTFGIGGPAALFIEVTTAEELQKVLIDCHKQKRRYFILGKGSNILFDDRGFEGLVILNKISFCEQKGHHFRVGAGYSFALLGVQTARQGWSGLEFASGIPGSVGGAVYMNAGAGGAETKDCLESVLYLEENGEILLYRRSQLSFSYRTSSFQQKKGAVLEATFALHPSSQARAQQVELVRYRTKTQPYGEKSAGCVFRNPEKEAAGAVIQRCGLKGKKIGGAEVSVLHGNFIINSAQARAEDVLELIQEIANEVQKKTGIVLEREICFIPFKE